MTVIQCQLSLAIVTPYRPSLYSPPVSFLGVVPGFVTSLHLNPLRNRTVLFLFPGQESLDSESLVRRRGGAPWLRKGEEPIVLFISLYLYVWMLHVSAVPLETR